MRQEIVNSFGKRLKIILNNIPDIICINIEILY